MDLTALELLLVAPVPGDPFGRSTRLTGGPGAQGSATLRTRISYEPEELRHEVERLPGTHHVAGAGVAAQVQLVRLGEFSALTCRFTTTGPVGTSLELEETCNVVVAHLLRDVVGVDVEPRWVNRTLLVDDEGDPVPDCWLPDDVVQVRIGVPGERGGARLGWGNNVVVGLDRLPPAEQAEVLLGLLDGQVVWQDLDAIATRSAHVARHQAREATTGRADVVALSLEAELLMTDVSAHNLLYDDLALHVQGVRRAVALGLLDAWSYDELAERIDRRVHGIEQVAVRRRDRLDASYQGAVQRVLTVLGVVSGTQLLLSVVALAFAGDVSEQAGGDRRGVMHLLRVVDTDVWLGVSLLLVVGVFGYLEHVRRRPARPTAVNASAPPPVPARAVPSGRDRPDARPRGEAAAARPLSDVGQQAP